MILSFAMFLNYTLKRKDLSDKIENSVEERVLQQGYRTKDIMQEGCDLLSTSQMGELIEKILKILWINMIITLQL